MGGVFRVRLHPLEPRGAESHGTYYVCNAQEHKARRVRQGNGDARMPPPSGTCARNERRAPAPSPSRPQDVARTLTPRLAAPIQRPPGPGATAPPSVHASRLCEGVARLRAKSDNV